MSYPKRGEIYWVNLDPTVGTEISKVRPGLIISNDVGNQYSDRVIIAPITSKNVDKVYPFEVLILAGDFGLSEKCKIALDQIRTVDKLRLGALIGKLSKERMELVNKAIKISVDV